MKTKLFYIFVSIMYLGCEHSTQEAVNLPIFVKGTNTPQILLGDNTEITLERADLAFGPLYLCAGVNAGDLCDVARLEWPDSVVINTLNSQAQEVGELQGVTGLVLSWMYDLGISSQLTRNEPFILSAAQELDGYSLVIEGKALVSDIELPFTVSMGLKQSDDTELGVPIIRKSLSDPFQKEVNLNDQNLTIQFDPSTWMQKLDFSQYIKHENCSEGSLELLCNGTQELHCAHGEKISERNCSDLGQVCISEQGCVDQLIIKENSEAYRSIRNSVISGIRPKFTWNQD